MKFFWEECRESQGGADYNMKAEPAGAVTTMSGQAEQERSKRT